MTDLAADIASMRDELDQLNSRNAIQQQLVRYGRGQEWLDETRARAIV